MRAEEDAMEMPRPTREHERLAVMAGTWAGEERVHPSPWDPVGGTAAARCAMRVALDGFVIVGDYEHSRGESRFLGHAVFTWDAAERKYLMYWFDSMGFPPRAPARGAWGDEGLVLRDEHPMGHTRYTYRFDGTDRYTLRIETSLDGQKWTPFIEGSYHKVRP
jgi:hypothetical protein